MKTFPAMNIFQENGHRCLFFSLKVNCHTYVPFAVIILKFPKQPSCNSVTQVIEMLIYEPTHDKTYDKTCSTREDSNQPARVRAV